jgi:hypothetical protein
LWRGGSAARKGGHDRDAPGFRPVFFHHAEGRCHKHVVPGFRPVFLPTARNGGATGSDAMLKKERYCDLFYSF